MAPLLGLRGPPVRVFLRQRYDHYKGRTRLVWHDSCVQIIDPSGTLHPEPGRAASTFCVIFE
eukprot:52923-Eustigmatos_ZCMA.PRE.1